MAASTAVTYFGVGIEVRAVSELLFEPTSAVNLRRDTLPTADLSMPTHRSPQMVSSTDDMTRVVDQTHGNIIYNF